MSAHDYYLDPDRAGLNDEVDDNEHIKEAFGDYDGPGQLYRSAYKYTACGPSVGLQIMEWVEDVGEEPTYEMRGDDWVQTGTQLVCGSKQKFTNLYCDDLYKLGTWADMDKKGQLVIKFYISSIVEGIDACTDTIEVPALANELEPQLVEGEESISDALNRLFWAAVEEVDKQAGELWDETHGCETCQALWVEEGYGDGELDGYVPVRKDCPNCGGNGTVI